MGRFLLHLILGLITGGIWWIFLLGVWFVRATR